MRWALDAGGVQKRGGRARVVKSGAGGGILAERQEILRSLDGFADATHNCWRSVERSTKSISVVLTTSKSLAV